MSDPLLQSDGWQDGGDDWVAAKAFEKMHKGEVVKSVLRPV